MPFSVDAAPIELSSNVRVELVESLSTRELWNTTQPVVTESGPVAVDSRMFDSEARPRNGKWRGCGVILIGTGDTGIQPVGVRIWTVAPCEVLVNVTDKTDAQSAAEFVVHLDSKQSLKIRVSSDLKVHLQDNEIGRIRE